MITTRWCLCVTMETLWQQRCFNIQSPFAVEDVYTELVIDVFYIFNSTVIDRFFFFFFFFLFPRCGVPFVFVVLIHDTTSLIIRSPTFRNNVLIIIILIIFKRLIVLSVNVVTYTLSEMSTIATSPWCRDAKISHSSGPIL